MTRVVLGLVALAALLHLGYAVARSPWMNYYVTPAELLKSPVSDRPLRLGGAVAEGTVGIEPGSLALRFELEDGGLRIPVVHSGSVPDTFQPGRTVILEGVRRDGLFLSHNLIVKCPHRYLPAL